jgi:hypothetical protein
MAESDVFLRRTSAAEQSTSGLRKEPARDSDRVSRSRVTALHGASATDMFEDLVRIQDLAGSLESVHMYRSKVQAAVRSMD